MNTRTNRRTAKFEIIFVFFLFSGIAFILAYFEHSKAVMQDAGDAACSELFFVIENARNASNWDDNKTAPSRHTLSNSGFERIGDVWTHTSSLIATPWEPMELFVGRKRGQQEEDLFADSDARITFYACPLPGSETASCRRYAKATPPQTSP